MRPFLKSLRQPKAQLEVQLEALEKPQIPIQNFVAPDHGDVGSQEQEGAEGDRTFEANLLGHQADDTEDCSYNVRQKHSN